MAVNMYKHMGKVVIKLLQGSVVTQTMSVSDGQTIYPLVARGEPMCVKNYENWQ